MTRSDVIAFNAEFDYLIEQSKMEPSPFGEWLAGLAGRLRSWALREMGVLG